MALNALVDSFLPQSEKNVGLKGLTSHPVFRSAALSWFVWCVQLEIYTLAGMYDKVFVLAAQTNDADAIRSVLQRSTNERLRRRCEVWLKTQQQPRQQHLSHHDDD